MSLKPYPAYQETNAALVGAIPTHWKLSRLGSALFIKKDIVGNSWSEHLLLSLTLKGVIPRNMENRMGKLPAEFTTYQKVVRDDLIFCLFDVEETPRTVGWVPESGMLTGAYTAAYTPPFFDSRYIAYHYLSYDQRKSLRGYYAGLRNTIRSADFANIPVAFPPLEEQRSIVSYLDRETAEIDAFIADQEELIMLLGERRTTAISRAVVTGLNPDAPMNESQVDWLGDVPKHWTVQPATAISRVITSTVDKKSYEGEIPVRLCNYTDVYYNDVVRDNPEYMKATATPAQIALFTPKAGDVAITKDSETSDDIGIPSYVPLDMPGIVFGYHLAIYRPEDKRYGRYLKYLFDSKYVKVTFENKTPGVTRVGLSQNTLKYLRIPTPPVQEAQAIADYLDRETAEIDAAIADAREAISFSKERRAAVISAAVTGKIDVREALAPATMKLEANSVGVA